MAFFHWCSICKRICLSQSYSAKWKGGMLCLVKCVFCVFQVFSLVSRPFSLSLDLSLSLSLSISLSLSVHFLNVVFFLCDKQLHIDLLQLH